MSRFFIGQRVKLVRDVAGPYLGMEGRIEAFHARPAGSVCRGGIALIDCDCVVAYDLIGSCAENTSRLEPLIPPHEASEYTFHQLMDLLTAGEVAAV